MPEGHLCQLQKCHCKGCYKAAAAACGCAGDDEMYHLLACNAMQMHQLAYSDHTLHVLEHGQVMPVYHLKANKQQSAVHHADSTS